MNSKSNDAELPDDYIKNQSSFLIKLFQHLTNQDVLFFKSPLAKDVKKRFGQKNGGVMPIENQEEFIQSVTRCLRGEEFMHIRLRNTGVSKVLVLDIDSKKNGKRIISMFKPLFYNETPNGIHLFFQNVEGRKNRLRSKVLALGLLADVLPSGFVTILGKGYSFMTLKNLFTFGLGDVRKFEFSLVPLPASLNITSTKRKNAFMYNGILFDNITIEETMRHFGILSEKSIPTLSPGNQRFPSPPLERTSPSPSRPEGVATETEGKMKLYVRGVDLFLGTYDILIKTFGKGGLPSAFNYIANRLALKQPINQEQSLSDVSISDEDDIELSLTEGTPLPSVQRSSPSVQRSSPSVQQSSPSVRASLGAETEGKTTQSSKNLPTTVYSVYSEDLIEPGKKVYAVITLPSDSPSDSPSISPSISPSNSPSVETPSVETPSVETPSVEEGKIFVNFKTASLLKLSSYEDSLYVAGTDQKICKKKGKKAYTKQIQDYANQGLLLAMGLPPAYD